MFILFGRNQLQLKEKHSWACENVDGSVERKEDFWSFSNQPL